MLLSNFHYFFVTSLKRNTIYTTMVELYEKQIKETEDLIDIAELLTADAKFKEDIKRYVAKPYDTVIEQLGKAKDDKFMTPMAFDCKGETLYLFGKALQDDNRPATDKQSDMLVKAINKGYVTGAHYISSNGLFLSLIESAAPNQLGFDITSDAEMEDKDFLFSKSRYFAVVSVDDEQENDFVDYMFNNGVNVTLLGHVTKGELRMDELIFGHITDYIF